MDALRNFREIGIGSRLTRVSEYMMKEAQKVYDTLAIDFDPYLFPVFKMISLENRTTNTELREVLHVSQPAITQTLNKLVKKELIVIKADEFDKRKKNIGLSPKGEKLLIRIIPIWNSMYEVLHNYTTHSSDSLVEHLDKLESKFSQKDMSKTMLEHIQNSAQTEVSIISFEEQYAKDFYDLNIEWLETFFYVEPHDEEVLSQAKSYIIDNGGHIFFAKIGDKIAGTVALIKIEDGIFELSKMAVSVSFRGQKVGQQLMQYCLDFSKEHKYTKLLLYSNRKLENAIYIYEKYGFVEIPIENNNPYARGDIKMELLLNI